MEIKIKDILTYVTFLAIILTGFGLIIINVYLSRFGLTSFDLFKPQMVYVGFVFIIFLLGHFIYYLFLFDLSNISEIKFWKIFLFTTLKFIVISNILSVFLFDFKLSPSFSENYWLSIIFKIGGFLSVNLVFITLLGNEYIRRPKHDFYTKLTFMIPIYISIVMTLVSFILAFIYQKNFTGILRFEIYFAIAFLMGFIGFVASKKDLNKGIKPHFPSFFGSNKSVVLNLFDNTFITLYFILMIFVFVYNYSDKIYPNFSTKLGGGAPEKISVVSNVDTINGELIFQTRDFLLIRQDSNYLLKVDWDKIQSIGQSK